MASNSSGFVSRENISLEPPSTGYQPNALGARASENKGEVVYISDDEKGSAGTDISSLIVEPPQPKCLGQILPDLLVGRAARQRHRWGV